jgi:hypothetical protein
MKISLNEIKEAFDFLVQEKKTREEITDWAVALQFAHDDKLLEFDPPQDKGKIWDAIDFLTGVDLKTEPHTYLHSIDDFIICKNKL